MNDMRSVIIAKSDQLNSDDLISGPVTITVTSVTIRPGTEQPVSIFYDGDNGKPYKCCKSMARVLVTCWGADANQYIGRSMTLYRDPKVTWGGMAVGGIRISHMTHIEGTQTMALTATKGSKKPFVVKPLKAPEPAQEAPASTSIVDWLKAIEIELIAAQTGETINAIVARTDTQQVLADDTRPKARDRLQRMIDTARDRVAPSQDGEGEVEQM
jgi:hypothetical protein